MISKRKYTIFISIVLLAVVLSGCSFSPIEKDAKIATTTLDTKKVEEVEKVELINVNLEVIFENSTSTYEQEITKDASVFKLMEKLKQGTEFDFDFKGSQFGVFINSINDIENNSTPKHYWLYYVNGKSALVGASDYILSDGDTVLWRYEDTSNFGAE